MFTKELWKFFLEENYLEGSKKYDFDFVSALYLMLGSVITIMVDIVSLPLIISTIIFKYILEKILNRKKE